MEGAEGGGGVAAFCKRQPVCVDSTQDELLLSAKAY